MGDDDDKTVMIKDNGWGKWENTVLYRLDQLDKNVTALADKIDNYQQRCDKKFAAHEGKIVSSRWLGALSGGGIVAVFLLVLLIIEVLR